MIYYLPFNRQTFGEKMEQCPCGSTRLFSACCQPFLSGQALAETPEQLMRSRYTAYTLADIDYIAKTMRPPASLHFDRKSSLAWANRIHWLKLDVLQSSVHDDKGYVEFEAHYAEQDKHYVLHEISEFQRLEGEWFYVDGETPQQKPIVRKQPKVGRNEPCYCGSGKKAKNCCARN